MFKSLRVIHISDLHCDSTQAWVSVFSPVADFLRKFVNENTLVVITGDLVNTPKKKHFDFLLHTLTTALINPAATKPLGIVSVPGNHDVFVFGNRFLPSFGGGWSRAKSFFSKKPRNAPYLDFASNLESKFNGLNDLPDPHLFPGTRERLLKEYGVAIYLFDSNHADDRLFAEGSVPTSQMHENEIVLLPLSNGALAQCKKIALLHHHPLSFHSDESSLKDTVQDAALELTNKFAFTHLLSSNGIDVVLHGHKHKSTKYSFDPQRVPEDQSFFVSGCGTSSKAKKNHKNEIKMYSFSSFEAKGETYTADPHQMYERSGGEYQLINAVRTRHRISEKGYTETCEYSRNNLSASTKTKELIIFDSGQVTAEIAFTRISFREQKNGAHVSLKELIAADTGRILSASAVFDTERLAFQDSQQNWIAVTPERPHGNGPDVNEFIELEVTDDRHEKSCPDTLRMQYHQRGGFALNSWSYDEIYSHNSSLGKKTEYCAIYSQIPVAKLELCVTFPESLFPPPNTFSIKVFERNGNKLVADGMQEISCLNHHTDEESFLISNNCLRIWQLSRTVTLHVQNPQPRLIYTVHWEVPKSLSFPDPLLVEPITKWFAGSGLAKLEQKRRSNLLKDIDTGLRSKFGENVDIYIFSPALRNGRKVLELIYGADNADIKPPAMFRGRGIAGAAYMQRRNVYYNKSFKSTDNLNVEQVVSGLEPLAVIGLPITYPLFFRNGKHAVNQQPVLIVTIVAEDETSEIYKDGASNLNSVPTPDNEKIDLWFQMGVEVIADTLNKNADIFANKSKRNSRGRPKNSRNLSSTNRAN